MNPEDLIDYCEMALYYCGVECHEFSPYKIDEATIGEEETYIKDIVQANSGLNIFSLEEELSERFKQGESPIKIADCIVSYISSERGNVENQKDLIALYKMAIDYYKAGCYKVELSEKDEEKMKKYADLLADSLYINNKQEAIKYYEALAKLGNTDSMVRIANIIHYYGGLSSSGVNKDMRKVKNYLRLATALGNDEAAARLAHIFHFEERNSQKAEIYATIASAKKQEGKDYNIMSQVIGELADKSATEAANLMKQISSISNLHREHRKTENEKEMAIRLENFHRIMEELLPKEKTINIR